MMTAEIEQAPDLEEIKESIACAEMLRRSWSRRADGARRQSRPLTAQAWDRKADEFERIGRALRRALRRTMAEVFSDPPGDCGA